MRRQRALRGAVAAVLAGFLVGMSCASGDGPDAPGASLRFEIEGPIRVGVDRHILQVFVVADSGLSFQAVDVDLSWTPASNVTQAYAFPEAAFDDDGALFGAASFDPVAGKLSHIADLRHGAGAALAGPVRVASALIVVDGNADLTLSAEGALARPDGILFDTAPAQTVVSFATP